MQSVLCELEQHDEELWSLMPACRNVSQLRCTVVIFMVVAKYGIAVGERWMIRATETEVDASGWDGMCPVVCELEHHDEAL
jgi:hypothetical protein